MRVEALPLVKERRATARRRLPRRAALPSAARGGFPERTNPNVYRCRVLVAGVRFSGLPCSLFHVYGDADYYWAIYGRSGPLVARLS